MSVDDLFKTPTPKAPQKYACTVVSFLPFTLLEEKPHMLPSSFCVPAAEGDKFGILHVEEGIHYIPNPLIDEGKPGSSIKQTTMPDEMARSIVEDYANAQVALSAEGGPGIFWVSGRYTQKRLVEEHADLIEFYQTRQKVWFRNLCALADADWQKNHNMLSVSDLQRMAARSLGIKADWVDMQVAETAKCKMCQSDVNPAAVVCSFCKHILKPAEYKKAEFANV